MPYWPGPVSVSVDGTKRFLQMASKSGYRMRFLCAFLAGWDHTSRPTHDRASHFYSRPKMLLMDLFGLEKAIDRFLVYSTKQQEIICDKWKLDKTQVPFTPFMVDRHSSLYLKLKINQISPASPILISRTFAAWGLSFATIPR